MAEPIVIGIDSIKFIKESTNKMVTLYKDTNLTTIEALKDSSTGSDYVVPSGKKLIILNVVLDSQTATSSTNTIYMHTTASTAGGTKIYTNQSMWDKQLYGATGINFIHSNIPNANIVYISVSAGNYINVITTAGGSFSILTCVELDA